MSDGSVSQFSSTAGLQCCLADMCQAVAMQRQRFDKQGSDAIVQHCTLQCASSLAHWIASHADALGKPADGNSEMLPPQTLLAYPSTTSAVQMATTMLGAHDTPAKQAACMLGQLSRYLHAQGASGGDAPTARAHLVAGVTAAYTLMAADHDLPVDCGLPGMKRCWQCVAAQHEQRWYKAAGNCTARLWLWHTALHTSLCAQSMFQIPALIPKPFACCLVGHERIDWEEYFLSAWK